MVCSYKNVFRNWEIGKRLLKGIKQKWKEDYKQSRSDAKRLSESR
jgi:hypothetical protein